MLNFDLMDTVAGQQIFNEGIRQGKLNVAREMILLVLDERFVFVTRNIREGVYSLDDHDMLRQLQRYAIRCVGMADFEAVLSKALAVLEADH